VLIQLALVATASLALLAIFALKVIEVALERRHVEAGVSVAEVVRRAMEKDVDYSGSLSPYIKEITLLPEGPAEGRPLVTPVGRKASPCFRSTPVDVTLPFNAPRASRRRERRAAPPRDPGPFPFSGDRRRGAPP
jgi:hypothetical protein